jgi:hypothetical protein
MIPTIIPTRVSKVPMPFLSTIKRELFTIAAILMTALVTGSASGQIQSLADDLQSVRPNLFLSEDLNRCGIKATQDVCVRPCDQVWLVSTRQVCGPTLQTDQLKAIQLVRRSWQRTSVAEFQAAHAGDVNRKSVFYIHGNMTDLNWSIVRGLQVYKNLIGKDPNAPPVRFVIWSWPSERETIPVRDAIIKARKAVSVGYTFRAFLDSLSGARPVLIGYSFGSQVVAAAMQSPYRNEELGKFYVTLIAPAFERDFIHGTMDGGQLAANVHRLDAYVNATDRVIKANSCLCRRKFRRSNRCDHLVSSKLDGCWSFLTEVDITDCQSKHSITLYSQQPAIVGGFRKQLNEYCSACDSTEAMESIEDSKVLEVEPSIMMLPE